MPGALTNMVSEFSDSKLKSLVQSSRSCIRDSGDFIQKIENITATHEDYILVTADVGGLCSSIPHDAGLKSLEKALINCTNKYVSTEEVANMVVFVLKKSYFEFIGEVKQQISETAIGTNFAPPYACILTGEVEIRFLGTQI